MALSKAKHQCLFVVASAFAVACGSGTTGIDGGAGSGSSSGQGSGAGKGGSGSDASGSGTGSTSGASSGSETSGSGSSGGSGAGSGAAGGASGADTDAAASSAAPGSDAGCPMGKNACGECESMHCCPQALACASDPQCVSYINCVAGCGATERCYQSCNGLYPSAAVTGENVELCVVDNCPTPCGDLAR
jgi:hypothetical protein